MHQEETGVYIYIVLNYFSDGDLQRKVINEALKEMEVWFE